MHCYKHLADVGCGDDVGDPFFSLSFFKLGFIEVPPKFVSWVGDKSEFSPGLWVGAYPWPTKQKAGVELCQAQLKQGLI